MSGGPTWRLFSRVVAVPWISAFAMHMATVVDRPLLRVTRGRWRLSFIIPCLLLRCRGARSGELKEVPLLYVPESSGRTDLLLIGSGGGSEQEPAWCANLRAHPQVECLRGGHVEARIAIELSGNARQDAWSRAVEVYPGYDTYQARLERQIPVFRLSRHVRGGDPG